jgi:hypothetical protein
VGNAKDDKTISTVDVDYAQRIGAVATDLRDQGREAAKVAYEAIPLPELQQRAESTDHQWRALSDTAAATQSRLELVTPTNQDAVPLKNRAFCYATGSVARGEAAKGSDLDVFLMGAPGQSPVSFVETAHIVSFLDSVREANAFRAFSQGGEYVGLHDFSEVLGQIGSRLDDSTNTFTARILLLLESRPLFNPEAYAEAKSQILDRYWGDRPATDFFLPIMLMNDIRRWWGAVGLNFEAKHQVDLTSSKREKAERVLGNLKLRYTRLLAVYSSLAGIIHISTDAGLVRKDLEAILDLTPVERLALIVGGLPQDDQGQGREILKQYDAAMVVLGRPKEELLSDLENEDFANGLKDKAYEFHRLFTGFYSRIGGEKTLFQYSIA